MSFSDNTRGTDSATGITLRNTTRCNCAHWKRVGEDRCGHTLFVQVLFHFFLTSFVVNVCLVAEPPTQNLGTDCKNLLRSSDPKEERLLPGYTCTTGACKKTAWNMVTLIIYILWTDWLIVWSIPLDLWYNILFGHLLAPAEALT